MVPFRLRTVGLFMSLTSLNIREINIPGCLLYYLLTYHVLMLYRMKALPEEMKSEVRLTFEPESSVSEGYIFFSVMLLYIFIVA